MESIHPWRRITRVLFLLVPALVLTAGLSLGAITPAHAHDQIISATPAEETTLTAAPTEVSLRFSAELLKIGGEIRVEAPDGSLVTQGKASLERDTIRQALRPDLGSGTYQVRWRVVSSDGHPINGAYRFVLGQPSASIPAPPSADPAGSEGPATGLPGTTPTPSSAAPASTGGLSLAPAVPFWAVAAGIGALLGLGAYVAVILVLRRRTRN